MTEIDFYRHCPAAWLLETECLAMCEGNRHWLKKLSKPVNDGEIGVDVSKKVSSHEIIRQDF